MRGYELNIGRARADVAILVALTRMPAKPEIGYLALATEVSAVMRNLPLHEARHLAREQTRELMPTEEAAALLRIARMGPPRPPNPMWGLWVAKLTPVGGGSA